MEDPNPDLEHQVDSLTLEVVIAQLAQICRAKADHLQENWQDSPDSQAVRAWIEDAQTLERLAGKIGN